MIRQNFRELKISFILSDDSFLNLFDLFLKYFDWRPFMMLRQIFKLLFFEVSIDESVENWILIFSLRVKFKQFRIMIAHLGVKHILWLILILEEFSYFLSLYMCLVGCLKHNFKHFFGLCKWKVLSIYQYGFRVQELLLCLLNLRTNYMWGNLWGKFQITKWQLNDVFKLVEWKNIIFKSG